LIPRIAKSEAETGIYRGTPGGRAQAINRPVRTELPSERESFLIVTAARVSANTTPSKDASQTATAGIPYSKTEAITIGRRVAEQIQAAFELVCQSCICGADWLITEILFI
jgi:hypothetical protein